MLTLSSTMAVSTDSHFQFALSGKKLQLQLVSCCLLSEAPSVLVQAKCATTLSEFARLRSSRNCVVSRNHVLLSLLLQATTTFVTQCHLRCLSRLPQRSLALSVSGMRPSCSVKTQSLNIELTNDRLVCLYYYSLDNRSC